MVEQYNVIVIMCDELKAKALSCYGNQQCITPNIDELSLKGLRYEHAYTVHPLCVPARISLWTSLYSSSHGCMNNQTLKPADIPHAFSTWKAQNYKTGLIGKNHCFTRYDIDTFFDVWCEIEHVGLVKSSKPKGMRWVRPEENINLAQEERKRIHAHNHDFTYLATDYDLRDYSTGLVGAQTEEFIKENKNNPFALWVSFPDPHPPYELPRKYYSMFDPEAIELPPNAFTDISDKPERMHILSSILSVEASELKKFLAAYYGMVKFIDDEIGRIIRAVRSSGIEERTIIVFTSDHGDFAGEYGLIAKGGMFFDSLNRIPLIFTYPGCKNKGYIEKRPGSIIDIVPTIFQLQGINVPENIHGQKLPLSANDQGREVVFSEYGAQGRPFRMDDYDSLNNKKGRAALIESVEKRESEGSRKMVSDAHYKYVHDPMGDIDELYDLLKDPWEMKNLADLAEYKHVKKKYYSILKEKFFCSEETSF